MLSRVWQRNTRDMLQFVIVMLKKKLNSCASYVWCYIIPTSYIYKLKCFWFQENYSPHTSFQAKLNISGVSHTQTFCFKVEPEECLANTQGWQFL